MLVFLGGASGKEPACQCRRCKRWGFDPWVGKMPWRRACQPTPVILPGNPKDRGNWWATVQGGLKESNTSLGWRPLVPAHFPSSILCLMLIL